MVVNLGGNGIQVMNSTTFIGSSNASAVDVLDARMANELEFSYEDGGWVDCLRL